MEYVKFSLFDLFGYTIPGAVALLGAVIIVTPNVVQPYELLPMLGHVSLVLAIVSIAAAYVIGFGLDSPGTWIYLSIGRRLWKKPHENLPERDLTPSEERVLVRQYSPANYQYIEVWVALKTMSHNLTVAMLILAAGCLVKAGHMSNGSSWSWLSIAIASSVFAVLFLHRAVIFDSWQYRDLSNATDILELEAKVQTGVTSSNTNRSEDDLRPQTQ